MASFEGRLMEINIYQHEGTTRGREETRMVPKFWSQKFRMELPVTMEEKAETEQT